MIRITVNGEAREVASGRTVEQFLGDLGLHPRMVVVEHNREILERRRYDATEVKAGDALELVHFVGGG
ncbi:MAG: sulfur carrier protein ThiS [Longimicrobiales bacterium]